jgi:hypothetical protein
MPNVETNHGNDVQQMHTLAKAEDALINRLDTKHLGYVTPDQLTRASHDKSLTKDEQHTAQIMLRTQDELRYNRLGYLPSMQMGDSTTSGGQAIADDGKPEAAPPKHEQKKGQPDSPMNMDPNADAAASVQPPDSKPNAYDAAIAAVAAPSRPWAAIHQTTGDHNTDKKAITKSDIKSFNEAVGYLDLAQDMVKRGPDKLAQDIMDKYAKEEPGKRLLPRDVWGAVDALSHKKDLTKLDKEELEILQATQTQMREMYPTGKEPTDHKSAAYKNYIAKLEAIPASKSDLVTNIHQVIDQDRFSPAVAASNYALHPGRRNASPNDSSAPAAPAATPASSENHTKTAIHSDKKSS